MTSLENIYLVMCNGISDIGKGWLAASLIGLDPEHTLPIKIDPLLNLSFPNHLGVSIRDLCRPEDMAAYLQVKENASEDLKISEDF